MTRCLPNRPTEEDQAKYCALIEHTAKRLANAINNLAGEYLGHGTIDKLGEAEGTGFYLYLKKKKNIL